MNADTKNTNEHKQPTNTNESRRDDDQFWTNWWREYAQTWK